MKKTGKNLIPQKIIEGKESTIQGTPGIFILINEFLAKYDDKKINKIIFLGGSRKDLRTISNYMFSKRIGKEIILLKGETRIHREIDCATETNDKLSLLLNIDWRRSKGFLLEFFSYYHNKLKDDYRFSGTDSHEWTKLRKYFSKHYSGLIDYINSLKLLSDSETLSGIQGFEMINIRDNIAKTHKSILERYKYKATTDVYYKLIEAVFFIKKYECLLLWNISRKNKQLLFGLILGLGNLHAHSHTRKILSSINIPQALTSISAPNLLIGHFKNADEFDKMPKQIKDFLQEFEVIDLGPGKTKTAQVKTKTNTAKQKGGRLNKGKSPKIPKEKFITTLKKTYNWCKKEEAEKKEKWPGSKIAIYAQKVLKTKYDDKYDTNFARRYLENKISEIKQGKL